MGMYRKNNIMINEDIRAEERYLCLLCDSKGTALYQDLRDRLFAAPGNWALLRCPRCGLVWLNPQPVSEDIGKLYSGYFTHDALEEPAKLWRNTVKLGILRTAFGHRSNNVKRLLGWLVSCLGPLRDIVEGSVMWLNSLRPGKLLDVGCGNGQFLDRMRELGWGVIGVEPDKQAAKVARERLGLSIHEGLLEKIAFPDETFDAVTMNHVVEHLPDPINTLRECHRILKKGGRLVVTVPNIESLGHHLCREAWRGLEVPRHLFLFSLPTLRACVERSELQVLELRTTARTACQEWAASRLIRRNGTFPGDSPLKRRLWLRLEGLAFWIIVEYGASLFRPVGEEIVLVATK
jgi:2-polyprenyl-3-methyl-5-hydroxy-6-metoxy-1,4-benzoquinol methylase